MDETFTEGSPGLQLRATEIWRSKVKGQGRYEFLKISGGPHPQFDSYFGHISGTVWDINELSISAGRYWPPLQPQSESSWIPPLGAELLAKNRSENVPCWHGTSIFGVFNFSCFSESTLATFDVLSSFPRSVGTPESWNWSNISIFGGAGP